MIESVTSATAAASLNAANAYAADASTSPTGDTSTTGSASSSSSNSGMNSLLAPNEFLSLLVDNLKYQDPLDPTSSADLLTQLASLSQVQTQQQIAETDQTSAAANLIGDTIAGERRRPGLAVTGTVSGLLPHLERADARGGQGLGVARRCQLRHRTYSKLGHLSEKRQEPDHLTEPTRKGHQHARHITRRRRLRHKHDADRDRHHW